MTQETRAALLFPGQGLPSKDIVACYQRLNSIDSTHIQQRLGRAQDAINKVHGSAAFDINIALQDEKSPSFTQTSFVQPVVYTLSVLTSEITDAHGIARIAPSFVAGHSLGEYSALTRAKVFDFEQGVDLVTYRGLVMEEACQKTKSVLLRISGLAEDRVRELCQPGGTRIAEVALINAPTLIVVGCAAEAATEVDRLAKEAGARGATDLGTAGAFHTTFMEEAADKLDKKLFEYDFKHPEIPVVTNFTGKPIYHSMQAQDHLIQGMINPVQWAKVLETLQTSGVTVFAEVGPGTSLAALNRINNIPEDRTINVLNWFEPRGT